MNEQLQVTRERGVAVIRPTVKRLDASVAPAFKQAVLRAVQDGEPKLVIDLEEVDFVDSSGLGAMVSILKSLGAGGAVAVCNVKGAVGSLFKLTRMDKVFAILPGREEAITRLVG